MGSCSQAGRRAQGQIGSAGRVTMLEVGQWVWALNENLILSVKSFIVENIASLVYDSKVGRGWVYLVSLCCSGLLKLNQGIGPGREDLKAVFRVKWQGGTIDWSQM